MSRPLLLDASFLIDLDRETRHREEGPARKFLPRLIGRKLVISVVTAEEMLEGAADEKETLLALQRFTIQGLLFRNAQKCAQLQRRSSRRMGENDAWLVATAEAIEAEVVGADRGAFERLGQRYLRFR